VHNYGLFIRNESHSARARMMQLTGNKERILFIGMNPKEITKEGIVSNGQVLNYEKTKKTKYPQNKK